MMVLMVKQIRLKNLTEITGNAQYKAGATDVKFIFIASESDITYQADMSNTQLHYTCNVSYKVLSVNQLIL